jgi:hypothetical protein
MQVPVPGKDTALLHQAGGANPAGATASFSARFLSMWMAAGLGFGSRCTWLRVALHFVSGADQVWRPHMLQG